MCTQAAHTTFWRRHVTRYQQAVDSRMRGVRLRRNQIRVAKYEHVRSS